MTEPTTVHHQTRRGADLALAKRLISRASYDAVLAGEIDLQQAKELGRSGTPTDTSSTDSGPASATETPGAGSQHDGPDTPPQPTSRISKDDTLSPCLCGCGELVARRFKPGHDMRMVSLAKAHLRGEAEPSEEQLDYLKESGKLERARQQIEKEQARRQEKIAKKTEAQRQREGEAEHKKRNASE